MELRVIWDRRDGMAAWRRGIIRPPDRPSLKTFIVEIVSVVFITGGIVGELWAGVEVTSINGRLRSKSAELRSKSDQLLALVTQEAGNAKASAEGAAGAAARANAQAGKAQQQVEALSKTANDLQAKLEQTENEVGQLTRELAKEAAGLQIERATRLEMEKSIAPRIVTWGMSVLPWRKLNEEYKGLQVILRKAPDGEAKSAAREVVRALHGAGFEFVSNSEEDELEEYRFVGVSIYPCRMEIPPPPIPPNASSIASLPKIEMEEFLGWQKEVDALNAEMGRCRRAADAVKNLLDANGWLGVRIGNPAMLGFQTPANTIAIDIGLKPSPYFLPQPLKDLLSH